MSAVWKCYECGAEHPGDWRYCPQTGVNRMVAGVATPPDVPRSWRGNVEKWRQFKTQLDDLDEDELRCAGLMRTK